MSNAVTEGIRIAVSSRYLPAQSHPGGGRFVFAYTVTISNESDGTVQLRTRHWIITDADEGIREVKGEGVVGEQPVLAPGESFEYTSGCILATRWGTMHGSYHFEREGLQDVDAEVAPFLLASHSVETAHVMN